MNDFRQNRYHFIGLGGIGMSALARVLLQQGVKVQGSDAVMSPLLERLQDEGVEIRGTIEPNMVVVYSTGIRENHPERIKAKELELPIFHRSELLDQLIAPQKGLLVTGTHGKTTTTSILASVLIEAGWDPSFVIGGIGTPLRTNGKKGRGGYFIAEADESDGSFLKTKAYGAIVTNLEDEHLPYWKTSSLLDQGFATFFSQVKCPEHLFWCGDDLRLAALKPPGFSYGFSEGLDWKLSSFASHAKGIIFDLTYRENTYGKIDVSLMGRHNALNSAAVFALALSLGMDEEIIRKAFKEFKGVERRLEWKGEKGGVEFYDDYGHHPTEIDVTVSALKERIGNRRLIVLFQPHRYSRVKDLFKEFVDSFEKADLVAITDIYSANEPPIEGITSEALLREMEKKVPGKFLYFSRSKLEEEIIPYLRASDVVLTIGAGDITQVSPSLLLLYPQKVS